MSKRNENGADRLLADILGTNGQILDGPVYAAYARGTCVEMGDNLDELARRMIQDMDGGDGDVVIWQGSRVAAVLLTSREFYTRPRQPRPTG